MIEDVVNSKVKAKLFRLFRKGSSFSVSEAARLSKVSKSRASECLKELSEKGVLVSRPIGRSIIYSPSSTILAKKIAESIRGEEYLLDNIIKSFVKEAKKEKPLSIVVFGSSVQGIKIGSDVDFFVVSSKKESFYKIGSRLTEKFGIMVSVMVMDVEELRRKAKLGEEFVINVIATHRLVYGKDMEGLIWQEK